MVLFLILMYLRMGYYNFVVGENISGFDEGITLMAEEVSLLF